MEPEVMLTWNRRITRQSTVSIETFPETETITVVATSYIPSTDTLGAFKILYIDRLAQELMIVWFGFRKETIMVLCKNYNNMHCEFTCTNEQVINYIEIKGQTQSHIVMLRNHYENL